MAIADDLQNAHERGLQLGILVDEHGVRLVSGNVFEDISRLAFERLTLVIPTLSASSFSEICRSAMTSSR